jgi:DNA-binding IclR family transcriptional regulator
MSDFKSKPGTFLPFLEFENKRAEQRANASPLTLLEILARQSSQALPIFDLQGHSGMEPSRYAGSLKTLRDSGYIAIEGEAPEQLVRLTDRGAEVVRLAKPA